jgi:membrane protease YdiL (CAAX protease family)
LTDIEESTATIPPVLDAPAPPPGQPTWPTWLEILLCSGYPTQIVLGQLLMIAGIAPLGADGSLSAIFVFALSIADTLLLLSLIVFLLVRRGERPAAVFFGGRPAAAEVRAGVFSFPAVIIVVVSLMIAIRRFLPSLHNVPENPLEGLIGTGASAWLFLLVVIVAGGVREELQRAFLLHRFRSNLGKPWIGLVITSLAFGMGHTLQGLDAAVVTATLGAIWGAMYLTRGSALASVVSHSLFNSGELVRAVLR